MGTWCQALSLGVLRICAHPVNFLLRDGVVRALISCFAAGISNQPCQFFVEEFQLMFRKGFRLLDHRVYFCTNLLVEFLFRHLADLEFVPKLVYQQGGKFLTLRLLLEVLFGAVERSGR